MLFTLRKKVIFELKWKFLWGMVLLFAFKTWIRTFISHAHHG